MTVFFGFTLVDSIVPENAIMYKQVITQEQAIQLIKEGVKPCLEQSWQALMNIASRLGITTSIPTSSNAEELSVGDSFLVLNNQHGYTEEDIPYAKFKFTLWTRLA